MCTDTVFTLIICPAAFSLGWIFCWIVATTRARILRQAGVSRARTSFPEVDFKAGPYRTPGEAVPLLPASEPIKSVLILDWCLKQKAGNSCSSYTCPKCTICWDRIDGPPEYCECSDCLDGHFHMKCFGKLVNGKQGGCKASWIMRSADTKNAS